MSLAQVLYVLGLKSSPFAARKKKTASVLKKKNLSKKKAPGLKAASISKSAAKSARVDALFLRPLESRDYENWRQAHQMMAPSQNRFDEGPWKDSELTPAKFREMLANRAALKKADKEYIYGIFREDDGVLVGDLAFMDISRGAFQNAYLGYRIFNPYWGRGYATRAVQLALLIAFKNLKLHRVEAGISPDNEVSIKVAEGAGLRCEGLSRRRLLLNGTWEDLLLFAGTCEDFGFKYHTQKFTK